MTDYTIINGTGAQLANVNAGLVDVEAHTYKNGVALDSTELATLLTTAGVAVVKDLTGVANAQQIKRVIGMAAQYLSA